MAGKYDNVIAALKSAKAELPEYQNPTKNRTWSIRKAEVTKIISATEKLYDNLCRVEPVGSADAIVGIVNHIWFDWRNHSYEALEGDFCLAPTGYVVFVAETLDAWIELYEEANHAR